MVLDYSISAQKYPKIVTQEKEKFKESPTVFFFSRFFTEFCLVFHMIRCINPTFHQNKTFCADKTGEGIMVLDYAISAQKCPKIVLQEKKNITP